MTIEASTIPKKLPTSFRALNQLRPLYPIRDEPDYETSQEIAGQLAIMDTRTDEQDAYLETLSILMEAYERQHHAIDTARLRPLDALKFLLEENDMSASDLGRLLGNRQLGSKILNGQRQLSKAHIRQLCNHFRVTADVFIR